MQFLYQCSFFTVQGNGQAFLAMTHYKQLLKLSIKCKTVNKMETSKLANRETKSKRNNDFKINPSHIHKINMEIDYIIVGLKRIMHNDSSNVFT